MGRRECTYSLSLLDCKFYISSEPLSSQRTQFYILISKSKQLVNRMLSPFEKKVSTGTSPALVMGESGPKSMLNHGAQMKLKP